MNINTLVNCDTALTRNATVPGEEEVLCLLACVCMSVFCEFPFIFVLCFRDVRYS